MWAGNPIHCYLTQYSTDFTTQIVRWIKSILFICFQREKRNLSVFKVVIAVFWKKCPSEILSFVCFGAYHCPSFKEIKHVCACTNAHTCFISPPLSQRTVKCWPHNSATFSVGFYQYLLPTGPGASYKATQSSNQNPLHSDSDSNTIQFPDHGKGFSLNFPVVNLEL